MTPASLRALVCGSTQGIGLAIAQKLSKDGFSVCLTARNQDKLNAALATLDISSGQTHTFFVSDFTDPAGLKIAIDNYITLNGPVHVLINNTGGPKSGPIVDADISEFLGAFNQHLIECA